MTVRYYSSVASEKTLTGTITSGQTTMVVSNTVGLPGLFPYTLAVDYETATEELVEVTNAAGTTLTITRAIDGTSASSHTAGARIRHVTSARDFSDSRTHENSSTNIHGLGVGEVIVGTTSTQTLSNKTFVNAQGTFQDPDFNLTGTATSTWTRTPAGADTVVAQELVNGSEQTYAQFNNGHLKVRNPAALDTATTTRRVSVTMANGTTERFAIEASGQVISFPRSGTANTNAGFKVVDPGDLTNRRLIKVMDSTDTMEKFTVSSGGTVSITGTDPASVPLFVKAPASPTVSTFLIFDNASSTILSVDSTGVLQTRRRAIVFNDLLPGSIVLQARSNAAQTGDIQQWQTSGASALARVRANGSADFASVVTSSGIFTPAAGWSVTSEFAVVKAGIATIAIRLERTGANITADAFGDLATDPPLGNVVAAFRPHTGFSTEFLTWAGTSTSGTGSVVLGAATGDMAVVTFSNNGTIATGGNFHWTMSYPLNFT